MPMSTNSEDQISGVVGGALDVTRDTNVDERGPSILDAVLSRRHQAEHRARMAERIRRSKLPK
jgi:hypothetical protein